MDFDWSYEMPGYDAGNLEQYDQYDTGGYDWGGGGDSDFQWQDMMRLEQQYEPEYTAGMNRGMGGLGSESSAYEQPSGFQSFTQQPPASMGQQAAPQIGGPGGSGGGREEEGWLSRLAKAGLGMGVGAGTTVLGNVAQSALAPKQKAAAAPQAGALPLPQAPTTPTYQPEALEPLPGTKASPLISGRPTQVRGSAGLRERRPAYGGFSMY